MSLDDWLQTGKWAAAGLPDLSEVADRALQSLGGGADESRRKAKKAAEKGKERLQDATAKSKERLQQAVEKYEVGDRVQAVKERASAVKERASAAAEKTVNFVKERPGARIARAGVQIKSGLTGFGAGYLFPDVEVLFLGTGGRGRWIVQSGLPVWGAERLARALLVDKAAAEGVGTKAEKWKVRKELYRTVAAPLLTGFSAGLGLRLVQDAVNVRGLPDFYRIIVGGKLMIFERIWMLGNGIWCFAMGKDLLMVTLGRAESQTLTDMLKKLREEPEEDEEGI